MLHLDTLNVGLYNLGLTLTFTDCRETVKLGILGSIYAFKGSVLEQVQAFLLAPLQSLGLSTLSDHRQP